MSKIDFKSKIFVLLMFLMSFLGYLALQNGWLTNQTQSSAGGESFTTSATTKKSVKMAVLNPGQFSNFAHHGFLSTEVFSGQPTLIHFWASWCKKCRGEEFLPQVMRRFSGLLNILVSASYDSENRIKKAKSKIMNVAPVLHDLEGRFAKRYAVQVLPQTILLDGENKIVSRIDGPLNADNILKIEKKVEELLGEKSVNEGSHEAVKEGPSIRAQKRFSLRMNPQRVLQSVGAFLFDSSLGISIGSEQVTGRVWVANFVSSDCGSRCSESNTLMKELQDRFFKNDSLHFLSFSVDPTHDTPVRVSAHLREIGADLSRWYYLTGEWPRLREFFSGQLFLDTPQQPPLETDRIVLVDQKLNIRGYYSSDSVKDRSLLREDISLLLNELDKDPL